MRLYEECQLLVSNTAYLVVPQPHLVAQGRPALQISRPSGEVSLCADPAAAVASMASSIKKKKNIYGVLGLVKGPKSSGDQSFLMVISRRVRIGVITGYTAWRIEAVEIFNVNPTSDCATPEKVDPDVNTMGNYLTIRHYLITVLSTPYFYFSYDGDLSQTQQRMHPLSDDETMAQRPLLERMDERFVWNEAFLSALLQPIAENSRGLLHPFLVPVIHGAVFTTHTDVNSKSFTWSIISRRSRHRVGARLFVRGCDAEGHVANFIETEQIVEHAGRVSSFVQTRGSIPLFWKQDPNIEYKPNPTMVSSQDSISCFLAHFKEQLPIYGEQVIVNLVDQKKAEGELEVNFKNIVREAGLSAVQYYAFDFHRECKNMQYDRLNKLVRDLENNIQSFEYFFMSKSAPGSLKQQKGVFRTNCIDCLDRTNVVQSLLASENLKAVMTKMGILSPGEDILKKSPAFQQIFRNTWADNADLISIQYAGTGALKTDFTRTGVRSFAGLLNDGWNAINRYYINNFLDGYRTDANRFFVGEVTADQLKECMLTSLRKENMDTSPTRNLPLFLLAAILVMVLTLLAAQEASVQLFSILLICLFSEFAFVKIILLNGEEFTNKPVTLATRKD